MASGWLASLSVDARHKGADLAAECQLLNSPKPSGSIMPASTVAGAPAPAVALCCVAFPAGQPLQPIDMALNQLDVHGSPGPPAFRRVPPVDPATTFEVATATWGGAAGGGTAEAHAEVGAARICRQPAFQGPLQTEKMAQHWMLHDEATSLGSPYNKVGNRA